MGYAGYNGLLTEAAEESGFNVTVYTAEEISRIPASLRGYDVIFLEMLGSESQMELESKIREGKAAGAKVIVIHSGETDLGNVNVSAHPWIEDYWGNGGTENARRLLGYLAANLCGTELEVKPPLVLPDDAIYHPEAEELFESLDSYLEWYGPDPGKPTAGILFYKSHYATGDLKVVNELILSLEAREINVVAAYQEASPFLLEEAKPDIILSLKAFRMSYDAPEEGIKDLERIDVPVMNLIQLSSENETEWRDSEQGIPWIEIPWQVAQPELDGTIEHVVIGGNSIDPVTGFSYYEPIEDQIKWVVNRTISWIELRNEDNPEKRIAVIYYNHGGGKDNFGASYLNVPRSLDVLLKEMKKEGYYLGERETPNETELIELMQKQGKNIGTWSPGELDGMAKSGKVVLLPVERYLNWFKELPEDKREEVIERWGEPPGEIMVWRNETENKSYFVIPRIELGNVILAPQPTRGSLQNGSVLYHDKELVPHHQYIAFYFWLNREYKADAIIHFGKHGTQEWLPGKESGLSIESCWPAILIQDMPVIYPYEMDNVGEGTQAKRRGNAVIVDHLTPPIESSGLYRNFSELHHKIHLYLDTTEPRLKEEYRQSILDLCERMGIDEDVNFSVEELREANLEEFEELVIRGEVHQYLHELSSEYIPYGLHALSQPPEGEGLIKMVKSMLGEEYEDHVEAVYDVDHVALLEGNKTMLDELLEEVIINNTPVEEAQYKLLGTLSENITTDLELALTYSAAIAGCDIEIPRILAGLEGRYIPPKMGNDPIRSPEAIPTGNNFYSFDSRIVPTKEAWEIGKELADQLIAEQLEKKGAYPNKVAFVLWSVETMRHQGITESEILYLLGAKPVWDGRDRVVDIELINSEELGRPRIDVLVTTSGLYRDTFPDKVRLIDKAVTLVSNATEEEFRNYARENSFSIYSSLLNEGYNESVASNLSKARIFSESPGAYGTNLDDAVAASSTWENETKLANLYIKRLSHVYGEDTWGIQHAGVFEENLKGVDVALHSQSSNLNGVMDNDDYFQYLGGLALAVRNTKGETPDLYISNQRNPGEEQIEELNSYLTREQRARYFSPKWITGMKEEGYAGAREMAKFVEYQWGWDVMVPELITERMWNETYEVYVKDKYDLGLEEFFKENPYAYQSITARMLEVSRKGYWHPSEEVLEELAKDYAESVAEHGVTCCHHTCGNPLLREYIAGLLSAPGVISTGTALKYNKEVLSAAGEGGVGEEEKVIVGKVMAEVAGEEGFPISATPLVGVIAVIVILLFIYAGYKLGSRKNGNKGKVF
jgi:cobaltochelatase CobN